MPRGGKRIGAGRRKVEPENSPKIGKGFALRVLGLIGSKGWTALKPETVKNAEEYALTLLAAGDERSQRFFDRLLDRGFGKPPQPVFHADTRESVPDVDFGDLPMPTGNQPVATGKPN